MENFVVPKYARKNKSSLIKRLCNKIWDELPDGYSWVNNQDYELSLHITPYINRFTFTFYYRRERIVYYDNWDTYCILDASDGDASRRYFDDVDLYNRHYCLDITWYTGRAHADTFAIKIAGCVNDPNDSGSEKYSYLYITFSELNDRLQTKFNLDDLLSKTDSELYDMCKIMADELLKYHKELLNHIYNQAVIPATKDWTKEYFTNLVNEAEETVVLENLSLHELFDKAYSDE